MAKVLRCADFMVGCPYAVRGTTDEEIVRETTKHLADVHHIQPVTPGIAAAILRNIRTE